MLLYIGTHDPAWGHTWVTRGFGKVYALRSLAGGSALCVFDEASMAPFGEYPTPGEHSCHITLLDRRAVVADYTSGTLSLYSLDPNGLPTSSPAPSSLPALTGNPRLLRFEGSGPVPVRQESPHVHSSWLAPDGRSILVVDLGSDALYRFQVAEGQLVPESRERFAAPAGSGPRHCCFGRGVLYVATELSDEVLVYSWPEMVLLQRCVTNPERPGGGGHLVLSPDGRFLYVSSRLRNDGIAVFSVGEDGLLAPSSYAQTARHPRHFCLSPDGGLVFVACRDDDRIQLFHRSADDGSLTPEGQEIAVSRPVYINCE